uniref:Uncharacterized protein LOC101490914 n=1 Tax=Cicer arietinum TaxID=3827 RepID=A0A1S2Z7M8_CICAR|nr:uncharacterized protein LOC101490914 [Cicer arietinum]
MIEAILAMNAMTVAMAQQAAVQAQQAAVQGARQMMEGNHEEVTWEVFKRKFLDKYFPKSAKAEKEAQFLRLYQGSLTVFEYAAKFESLAKHFCYYRNQMDEEYMCKRFESRLMYEIKEYLEPLEIHQYQGNGDQENRGRQFQQQKPYARPQEGHRITESPERTRVCYACQKLGHLAKGCREKDIVDNKDVVNNKDIAGPTTRGHVYHISGEETPSSSEFI